MDFHETRGLVISLCRSCWITYCCYSVVLLVSGGGIDSGGGGGGGVGGHEVLVNGTVCRPRWCLLPSHWITYRHHPPSTPPPTYMMSWCLRATIVYEVWVFSMNIRWLLPGFTLGNWNWLVGNLGTHWPCSAAINFICAQDLYSSTQYHQCLSITTSHGLGYFYWVWHDWLEQRQPYLISRSIWWAFSE